MLIRLHFSICTTLQLTQARMDCALVITHLERDLVVTVDKSLNISAYCSNRAIVIRSVKWNSLWLGKAE